ncbi:MAG: ROK family protein [Chloroflexota bacterium]
MKSSRLIGGIEGGGTKFNLILAEVDEGHTNKIPKTLAAQQIPTTTPAETLSKVIDFFQRQERFTLNSIGLACFGPLNLDTTTTGYGQITKTSKPGWSGFDVLGELQQAIQVPVYLDTDVNSAAIGEHLWGAGKSVSNLLYLTVGTGIGGGVLVDGKPLHGLTHPEMGHINIPHDLERDPFPGDCPIHGNCLEGLASGSAIGARWQAAAETLPAGHPAWKLEAEYLGTALTNFILTLSPQRIILGGGVMKQTFLHAMVREVVLKKLNGYIPHPAITEKIERYIMPPGLGDQAGVLGAVGLALVNVKE